MITDTYGIYSPNRAIAILAPDKALPEHAREVRFGDGRTHYEHNYKHQHHDHMICSECGKIIEFYSAQLEAIQDAMAAKHKFEVTQHLLRIIGVCADCRRARKERGKQESAVQSRMRVAAARGVK